jgi:multidrug efflux system membrane fusion protein
VRKHWPLGLGIVLVLAAVAAGALWLTRPLSVAVTHPYYGPAVQAVYATGTVEPAIMMPIAPRLGARLVALAVDEGDIVKKGQVLARLESDDLTNTVAQLAAQEEFARRQYLRYQALVKGGIVARQTFEQAKANYEAASAATRAARAQIGYMTLSAPSDGRIIKRDGEVGQFLPVNQPLFWLSCLTPLRISAEVDEEDIALVEVGQEVLIRADAFPGQTFHGHVQQVTPKGDSVARSYRVRIAFDGPSPLKVGMTSETNIITRRTAHALLVPAAAVTGDAVWTVVDGHLVHRAVRTGVTGKDAIEIKNGLSASDTIAVDPDPGFIDGQRVTPATR